MLFGKKLRKYRIREDLSISEMAEFLGIEPLNYFRIEEKGLKITSFLFEKITYYLALSTPEITKLKALALKQNIIE